MAGEKKIKGKAVLAQLKALKSDIKAKIATLLSDDDDASKDAKAKLEKIKAKLDKGGKGGKSSDLKDKMTEIKAKLAALKEKSVSIEEERTKKTSSKLTSKLFHLKSEVKDVRAKANKILKLLAAEKEEEERYRKKMALKEKLKTKLDLKIKELKAKIKAIKKAAIEKKIAAIKEQLKLLKNSKLSKSILKKVAALHDDVKALKEQTDKMAKAQKAAGADKSKYCLCLEKMAEKMVDVDKMVVAADDSLSHIVDKYAAVEEAHQAADHADDDGAYAAYSGDWAADDVAADIDTAEDGAQHADVDGAQGAEGDFGMHAHHDAPMY